MTSEIVTQLNMYTHLAGLDSEKEYPTPVEEYVYEGIPFFVKREDMLTLKCAKQRSIVFMMMKYVESGKSRYVVASSGNAALVALYITLHTGENVKDLQILLSKNISKNKLARFSELLGEKIDIDRGYSKDTVTIKLCENPKQQAFLLEKEGYVNLRGSTDDSALEGFKTLGLELSMEAPDAIFVPSSSGSTALGIWQGICMAHQKPQMHIVQTSSVNALVKKVASRVPPETAHPAEAIVDSIGHRRKQIEEIISISHGKGWIVSAEECRRAHDDLQKKYSLSVSYDAALAFAALKYAIRTTKFKKPMLIITG